MKKDKEMGCRPTLELGHGTSVSWDGFYLVLEARNNRVETSICLPPEEMHNLFYYLSALLVCIKVIGFDPEAAKLVEEKFKDFLEQVDNVLDKVDKEAP